MEKKSISVTQAGKLCTIIILANKISLLPALLYEGAKSDGFFVALMLFAIELMVLGVFFLLKNKYPEASFKEILEKHLGKVFSKVIFIVLMAFFLFKLLLSYSVGYIYIKQHVYQGEFALFALICFIPVINHAVIKGLRVFSRTIELYYPVICVGIIICLAVSLAGGINIPLFFTSEPSSFFMTLFKHIFSFGDYLFLFIIMDRIEMKSGEEKKLFKFVALGIFLVLAILFMFYSLYQITAFMHNNALADITVSSTQFNAVGRLDIFAMVTRMFLSFFEMTIFHYAFSEAFCNVFTKLSRTYSVVVFDVIFAIVYFVLVGRFENMITYTQGWLSYLGLVTNYLIPLMLLFIALPYKKKRRVYEKTF